MSGQHPPVSCDDFKRVLKHLGFQSKPRKGTSHEQWIGEYGGSRRLVTVDCPKAPFTDTLLNFMLKQMGITRKAFYALLANV